MDFSHTRRWWPACLMDEMMPAGRARPEDWLAPDASGVTTIRWDDENPESAVAGTMAPGETAAFYWHERRGTVQIRVMPDGSWTVDDRRDALTVDMFEPGRARAEPSSEPPLALIAAANWFVEESDYETMADSMDEFARNWAWMDRPGEEGQLLTVAMGFWSEDVTFRVSADGSALQPVEATDA